MEWFFNRFDFLSGKQKRFLRENDIFAQLLLFLSSMFEYKGMDPNINTDFIEFYNMLSPFASCGIFEYKGKEVLGYCCEGGMLNEYGIPEKFNINTLSVQNKQGVVPGLNAAICWNNSLHRSDLVKLSRYTEMFNLCDTAMKCLIKYARLFPVFEVSDDNIKQQIDNAVKNAENGEPVTFTTKGLSKLTVDGQPGVQVFQLGDYNAVDKIQYLSTFHKDLLKRFYSCYGMSYDASEKRAQQSVEEVTADRIVSWIVPNDRLNERRKFIEQYNDVFGHSATVDFSDAWKKGYEKYMAELENGGDLYE